MLQSKRLGNRQAGKISLYGAKSLLKQKRVNPVLIKTILLNSTDSKVLDVLLDYFVERAKKGDLGSMGILNRFAVEKINPNLVSRKKVLETLRNLALSGDARGIRGLLVGVKDSDSINRYHSLSGLRALSKKGDVRVLPGLLVGVKDSDVGNRSLALGGLRLLSRRGSAEAKKFWKEYKGN
jgi:hypothetical protein